MSNNKKNKIHKFFPTIYPRKLWVAKGVTLDNINTYFTDYSDNPISYTLDDNITGPASAAVFKVRDKVTREFGIFVWINTHLNVKEITHESIHVASCIFDDCGMSMGFSGGQDEHFAYLAGFAADCIHQVVTGRFRE